ncbi:MAG: hypothetical protein FJ291_13715 [Planctomycetes bacterium]|nr:hypothetical protein [Planctomycetota bacterium]
MLNPNEVVDLDAATAGALGLAAGGDAAAVGSLEAVLGYAARPGRPSRAFRVLVVEDAALVPLAVAALNELKVRFTVREGPPC